jgi:hypothetical protein
MTLATIKHEVETMRDGVTDPDLKAALRVAAKRLVPGVERLTLEWIAMMLRDEGNRAACKGRDILSAWLTDAGLAVNDHWVDYNAKG